MVYSRRYSRNFIPLKQDSAKHNLDFRPSLGRCVIEIKDGKGKINVYTQGIKPSTDYYIELIGFEKGNLKNVCLGKFNVDDYGKGEFCNGFDPDDIFGSHNKIEDFNVISIMVKDNEDISSALVGYIGNPTDWKEQYKANAIINLPNNSCDKEYIEDNNEKNENNKSDFEDGLIEKEEGLIEREKGLIEKEKGLIEKEKNKTKTPLDQYERAINEKLEGLIEKEKGLIEKEKALKDGYLPTDDKYLRDKEMELIRKEIELVKIEQELINRERNLIRKNPTSEREKGLIEKEKGVLEKEQGLLEREKGLIEKEKGLLDIEKGIREKNKYSKDVKTEENSNTNHENFKNMLESLKRNMLDIENIQLKDNSINDDIDYIKSKNAIMTPFLNNDININWYRISPYDLTNLSPNSWRYCNNPFVFTCYKKYKHLMLGIDKTKEETYLLAVPCRYNEEFKLRDFKEFLPVDNNVSAKSINNGEYGYRIVEL